jgi:acetylglutamate kinase
MDRTEMDSSNVAMLIEALPYIREFRDKLFVVKLGGGLLKKKDHLEKIAGDLTLLHMVGIRLVLVHGGGPQANALSEELGFKPKMVAGRRVTDEATLEVAKMIFAGKLNTDFKSALTKHGCKAVGISGIDAGLIKAHKRPVTTVVEDGQSQEVDFGHVGDIDSVDPSIIKNLVENGFVPVVASLAGDGQGNVLNVNADTIAAELAIASDAEKLILLSGIDGVYKKAPNNDQVFSRLTVKQVGTLMTDGTVSAGMKPKLSACVRAVQNTVKEAHIINGLTPHSLLMEILTDRGIGTMIVESEGEVVSQ